MRTTNPIDKRPHKKLGRMPRWISLAGFFQLLFSSDGQTALDRHFDIKQISRHLKQFLFRINIVWCLNCNKVCDEISRRMCFISLILQKFSENDKWQFFVHSFRLIKRFVFINRIHDIKEFLFICSNSRLIRYNMDTLYSNHFCWSLLTIKNKFSEKSKQLYN